MYRYLKDTKIVNECFIYNSILILEFSKHIFFDCIANLLTYECNKQIYTSNRHQIYTSTSFPKHISFITCKSRKQNPLNTHSGHSPLFFSVYLFLSLKQILYILHLIASNGMLSCGWLNTNFKLVFVYFEICSTLHNCTKIINTIYVIL